MKSYKDLDIYKMAFNLAEEVHHLTLELPKYELYEQGSQLRRSSKSIKDNIVEGYGRRKYKAEFIMFLIYAQATLLETQSQLETIQKLYEIDKTGSLIESYNILGAKLFSFIKYVEKEWKV